MEWKKDDIAVNITRKGEKTDTRKHKSTANWEKNIGQKDRKACTRIKSNTEKIGEQTTNNTNP